VTAYPQTLVDDADWAPAICTRDNALVLVNGLKPYLDPHNHAPVAGQHVRIAVSSHLDHCNAPDSLIMTSAASDILNGPPVLGTDQDRRAPAFG